MTNYNFIVETNYEYLTCVPSINDAQTAAKIMTL